MTTPNAWKSGTWNPFPETCDALPEPADHIAWLMQRRDGIGSSDCAAILGLDKYSTPYSLFLDKSGQIPLSQIDSEPAEWGRLLEPVIRKKAAERLGFEVRLCAGLANKERPWLRCSLDGVFLTDEGLAIFEAKNTSQYLAQEWADDQVPDRAELQVMHSMAVTGADVAYVAGLIGGNKLVVRRVERDQELIDHINAEESTFWHDHVLARVTPPIVARDSIADIITAAGTPDDDGPLILDPEDAAEARTWVQAYQWAAADEKRAKDKKAEARNNLAAIAAGYTEVCDLSGDVQHTLFKLQRGVFAAKKFEEAHPDLVPLFLKKVEVIDTQALRAEDPALFRAHQAVSIRIPKAG